MMPKLNLAGRRGRSSSCLVFALLCCFLLGWRTSLDLYAFIGGSGPTFPNELDKQALVATGTKSKFGAASVYSVGFYLDRGVGVWGKAGVTADEVIAACIGKAKLRMVVTSDLVSRSMLVGKLSEKIAPRVKLSEGDRDTVMADFENAFTSGPELKTGTELLFSFNGNGIGVKVGDTHQVDVKGVELARALLGAYLDSGATIPTFRDDVVSAVATGAAAA